MREFIRTCEDDFDAIVKLTMVKYLLPKLRNRWGEEELIKQAARPPADALLPGPSLPRRARRNHDG